MKPRSFTYLRPDNLDEALQALARYRDDARVIAGGLSLVPMMNFRLIEAKALIDISNMASLAYIREEAGEIEIGAATTQSDVLAWPKLSEVAPLLSAAMVHIGHFQTRSRGTVCGSIAHSDPSSELPLCLATLGGGRRAEIGADQTGSAGERIPDRYARHRPAAGRDGGCGPLSDAKARGRICFR